MRTPPQSDRLSDYLALLRSASPPALKVWGASAEPEFFAAVESTLDDVLRRMEAGSKQHRALQERGLSRLLVQLLSGASIPASIEVDRNGHLDVIVQHPAEPAYAMLGACSVYDGNQGHRAECQRLLERCAAGRGSARAFCLDFFLVPGMEEKLSSLRAELAADRPFDQLDLPVDREIKGAFLTAHRLPSGAVVELLHLGCNLS